MSKFQRPFIFIVIGLFAGLVFSASITYAALTFSSSSVVSDGNLSLTASGTVNAGTGIFSFGTASGTQIQTGNVTTTNLTVSGLGSAGSPCLSVSSAGVVATTTCGTGGAGGQATSAAFTLAGAAAPAPSASSTCAPGVNPFMWIQDSSGTYQSQAGITTSSDATDGPTPPGGTMVFCRRTWFSDTGAAQGGKNAFVSINHTASVGTVPTNQDRALWVQMSNPANDTSTMYAMEGIQSEVDLFGNPSFSGHPDGEVSVASLQMADRHTGILQPGPQLGITAIRAQYFREAGAGSWGSCATCGTAISALATNISSVDAGSTGIIAGDFKADNLGAIANHLIGADLKAEAPGFRFTQSYGLFVADFGTNTQDFAIKSFGGQNAFGGPVLLLEEASATAEKSDASGQTVLWADTTTHLPMFSAASGTALQIAGSAAPLSASPTLVCTDSNGNLTTTGCPSASTGAGGTSTQVQFNSGGTLSGASDFFFTASSSADQLTVPSGTGSFAGLLFNGFNGTGFGALGNGIVALMSNKNIASAPSLRFERWTGAAYQLNADFLSAVGGFTIESQEASAGNITIAGAPATSLGPNVEFGGNGGNNGHNYSATASGTQIAVSAGGVASGAGTMQFVPASGNTNFVAMQVAPIINQTGTASGNYTALKIGVTETSLKGSANKLIDAFVGTTASTEVFSVDNSGNVQAAGYRTNVNCENASGTCTSASAGMTTIAASASTVTVNTTAVTANSEIVVTFDESLGTALSVTCNSAGASEAAQYFVSARSAGTSFTIKTSVAPTTNPACLSYTIIN